jgi:hypothetical protein
MCSLENSVWVVGWVLNKIEYIVYTYMLNANKVSNF